MVSIGEMAWDGFFYFTEGRLSTNHFAREEHPKQHNVVLDGR
jgi:hypothetical protein